MDETSVLKMFSINNLSSELGNSEMLTIAGQIVKLSSINRWWLENAYKYSLVKCDTLMDTYVYGWLTQEYQLQQHLYDEFKTESSKEIESFEDRFFILSFSQNILAIEWKKFLQRKPLTSELMIHRMQRILNEIIQECGYIGEIDLEQVPVVQTKKEEFLSIFYSNRIMKISVDNYGMDPIPDDVILVNPVPGLEGAMREIGDHDVINASIAKLSAEANLNRDGDLKKSAMIRTIIHSGDPTRMEYITPDSKIKIRKKYEKGELDIEIPILERDSSAKRIQMVLAVIEALEGRDITPIKQESSISQLSLFSSKDD